jgi:hypothetical protein
VLDEGTSARQIVGATSGPLRTVIVGIVDAVEGPASVPASAAPATVTPAATAGSPKPKRGRRRKPGAAG